MIDNYEERKVRLAELEAAKKSAEREIARLNAELDAPYITFWNAAGYTRDWTQSGTVEREDIRAGVDAVLAEAEKRHKRYCDTQQEHIDELAKTIKTLQDKLRSHELSANARHERSATPTKDLLEPYQSKLVAEARQVYWTEVGEPEHLAQRPSDKSFAAWRKVVGLIWREATK